MATAQERNVVGERAGQQAGTDWRLLALRRILISACLLGMAVSAPLWMNSRAVPLLPIVSWMPILPPPWDQVLFALVLLSLVVAFWHYRPAITSFPGATLFVYFGDQNRGQAWFYLYWLMLLLTLLDERAALAGCLQRKRPSHDSCATVWSGGVLQERQPPEPDVCREIQDLNDH